MEYNEETIREFIELLALEIINEIHWQDNRNISLGEYTIGVNSRYHYDGTYDKWYPEVEQFYYFVQDKEVIEDDEEPIIDGFNNVNEFADLLIDHYVIWQEVVDNVHRMARKRNEKMLYRMREYEKTLDRVGAIDEYYNYYTSDDHEIAIDQLRKITDTKSRGRHDLLTRYYLSYSRVIIGSVFKDKYTMTIEKDYDSSDEKIIFTINDAKTKKPVLNGKIERDKFVSISHAHNENRGLFLNLSYLDHQAVIDNKISESDIIVSVRRIRDYYVLAFQLKEEKNE